MADNNKAVGQLAAAKMVSLIKVEIAKQIKTIKAALDEKASKDVATQSTNGLMSASDYTKLRNIESGANKTVVDAALDAASTNPVQNKVVKTALDGKAGTAVATASANGLMSKDDKAKLDGVEAGANKTTVDAALDGTSENPVQNKAVKTELDKKLNQSGGTVTGSLTLKGAVFSDSGLSFGTGENIHFTKAADDAAKLAHGTADEHDNVPLARLKVAAPTEDDDAATKAYVDNNAAEAGAVRYDAAQTLTGAQKFQARKNIGAVGNDSPQFQGFLALAPANETLGSGVGLSPTGSGHEYTLDISDVDEGNPTLLTGVKTPTDADTNAAATVEYVRNKVAGATGGTVDAVMSDTSANAVQNKVIKKYVDDSAGKKLNQTEPVIKDGLTIENIADIAIRVQPDSLSSATGEDFASLDFGDNSPQGGGNGVVLSGLANFGDAEAAGLEDTAVSYAQLLDYTKPLMLTYNNNQVTGASYADIRRAIERGRQIKLSVANTLDIIASNAKNETNRSVLRFTHTDVGGDTVNISQYNVTAQASGLTANVKSYEIAQ